MTPAPAPQSPSKEERERAPLGVVLFVALVFLVVALVFLAVMALCWLEIRRVGAIAREGVGIAAVFLEERRQRTSSDPSKPARWTHYSKVGSRVDGRTATAERPVSEAFLRAHQPGERLVIVYLPNAPYKMRIDPAHDKAPRGAPQ